MISPGDDLRRVWTADFANRLYALLASQGRNGITIAGPGFASNDRRGSSVVIPKTKVPLSTIQGILSGGAAQSVSDGTELIDPYAWEAYSIQGAFFQLAAGTTNVTVLVNGVAVSWLDAIPVTAAPSPINIPNPVTDLTHVIDFSNSLAIQLSGSSADCAGFMFSLYCPF